MSGLTPNIPYTIQIILSSGFNRKLHQFQIICQVSLIITLTFLFYRPQELIELCSVLTKLGFQHPQTKYPLAFDLLVAAPLNACPYHPSMIGDWSLHVTFTVQMLSFQ